MPVKMDKKFSAEVLLFIAWNYYFICSSHQSILKKIKLRQWKWLFRIHLYWDNFKNIYILIYWMKHFLIKKREFINPIFINKEKWMKWVIKGTIFTKFFYPKYYTEFFWLQRMVIETYSVTNVNYDCYCLCKIRQFYLYFEERAYK